MPGGPKALNYIQIEWRGYSGLSKYFYVSHQWVQYLLSHVMHFLSNITRTSFLRDRSHSDNSKDKTSCHWLQVVTPWPGSHNRVRVRPVATGSIFVTPSIPPFYPSGGDPVARVTQQSKDKTSGHWLHLYSIFVHNPLHSSLTPLGGDPVARVTQQVRAGLHNIFRWYPETNTVFPIDSRISGTNWLCHGMHFYLTFLACLL